MSPSALILIGILTPTSGILGSLLWPILQRRFGWSNLKVLVILVIMASLIPAYGCLGFLVQGRVKFGGLTTPGEMFALAVYFGQFALPDMLVLIYLQLVQGLYMGLFRAMRGHFTRSYYHLEKRRGGTACFLSRTRCQYFFLAFSYVTDSGFKSSSFIGPLVVGLISDLTGNIRYAFFFLVFMVWSAVPILMSVDVDRGRKDAQDYEYRSHPSGP